MHRWLIAGFLILTITGCEGNISGKVFLDENSNSIRDVGEPGLGRILFKVTLDGAPYKIGITAEDGAFIVPKETSGDYCVTVESMAAEYLEPSTQPLVENIKLGKALTGTTCSADSDCVAGQTCQNGTCQQKICSVDADCQSGQECQNEKCIVSAKEPVAAKPPLPPPSSLKGCVRAEGYSSKASLDIPVALNMSASVASISKPEVITIKNGEKFEDRIYFPRSCKLLDLKLPQGLMPADDHFVLDSNTLDLSAMASANKSADDIIPSDLTVDVIRSIPFSLVATVQKTENESTTITFIPKAICANNSALNLPEHKIIVKNEKNIHIKQESKTSKIQYGENVTLSTTVSNNGAVDVSDATLVIALPFASLIVPSGECDPVIQQVECSISKLVAGESKTFTVTFKLPAGTNTYSNDVPAVIHTELKFQDGSQTIKVDPDIKFIPEQPLQQP